jgi:23S rRNA (guanine745-N1)-methyltransferase
MLHFPARGGVAEWSIALVLKTSEPQGSVGSNPTPSAIRAPNGGPVLADVIGCLACPHCGAALALSDRTLGCDSGHTFDVARQGYASLLPGDSHTGTADTAGMVAARETFLAAGYYEPLTDAVADVLARLLPDSVPGCVVDIGAGTGYYLAAVLDRLPDRIGIALDISKYALRRAARAHPRIGAVACNVWRGLPLRTGSAAAVMDIFSPRNSTEFRRVLAADGLLVVVTPDRAHLAELVGSLDLLDVDADKEKRLAVQLADGFELVESEHVERSIALTRPEADTLVAMGPSSRHLDPAHVAARLAALEEPIRTRLSVTIGVYQRMPNTD